MWRILKKPKPWPIGLDISSDGIRMLQMQPADPRPAVHAGAQWRRKTTDEDSHPDNDELVSAVRELLRAGAFQGRRVVSSIGGELEFHNVRLEQIDDEQLPQALIAEARGAFDFDVSRAGVFAIRAGPVVCGELEEFILMAVPDSVLQGQRESLRQAGLIVDFFDPEPFALLRAMGQIFRRSADRATPHAVIKISGFHTLVVIVRNGRILSVKSIDRGGANLARAAAEHLGLSFEDAQRLRQNCMATAAGGGNTPASDDAGSRMDSVSWALHDAVRTEAEELALQIELALRYCSTTFGCPKIQAVTLAGTNAWDPSLRILLAERLGREPGGYSPLRGVDVSRCSLFADRRGILSGWTTCTGLALAGESSRRIDQVIALPREIAMPATQEGGTP